MCQWERCRKAARREEENVVAFPCTQVRKFNGSLS